MADRDTRHETELDDWFDEPDTSDALEGRSPRLGDQPPTGAGVEDWSSADTARPAEPLSLPAVLRGPRAVWAAALILVVCLLGGLAAAGVFSSGHKASTTTTTPPTATAPATTTTSQVTRPQPTVAAPSTTLKPGDQGAAVKVLQRALAHLGYSAGTIDGQYGPSTTTAVERFQRAHGLTADGVLGPNTLRALSSALATG